MEIIKLRTLVTLAETGNFSRSAELLATTQSNVSKHILSLEKELDAPLFDRSHRQIVLTETGNRLLPYAKAILAQYDAMMQALAAPAPETVSAAVPEAAVPAPLRLVCLCGETQPITALVSSFTEYPLITEYAPGASLNGLQADFAVCAQPETALPNAISFGGSDCELVAVLPVWHSLSKAGKILPSQLADQTLLLHAESKDAVLSLCKAAGIVPTVRITSPRAEPLFRMAADGSGVSLVTKDTYEKIAPRGVIAVPVAAEAAGYALVCLHHDAPTPATKAFWDYAKSVLAAK